MSEETKGFKVELTGIDDDCVNTLVVTHNGKEILRESDSIEPEDVRFDRDLKWVPEAIRRAYELGRVDMADEMIDSFNRSRGSGMRYA